MCNRINNSYMHNSYIRNDNNFNMHKKILAGYMILSKIIKRIKAKLYLIKFSILFHQICYFHINFVHYAQ